MRLATGFLIALVACLWLGLAEAASPPAPQTGVCPTACNKATACSKATACNRATTTACAANKACDAATACQGQKCCEDAAAKDALMALMFGEMLIGNEAAKCSELTACAKTAVCEKKSACESAAGCETACAKTKACCEATAACENASACAKACNKSATCSKATPCETAAGCPGTVCAAAGECPQVIATDCASACESGNCCQAKAAKLAVASDETCEGAAGDAGNCCQSKEGTTISRVSHQQLEHLTKAAQHLAAAGLADEAECVRGMAAEVRQELIALMTENIANLQAEIAALGGEYESECAKVDSKHDEAQTEPREPLAVAPPRSKPAKQVAMNLKVVEVSLNNMRDLGFDFAFLARISEEKGSVRSMTFSVAQPAAMDSLVSGLQREHLAKVMAWPTVVTADGGSFEVKHQESGAHLDVQAKLLDDNRVRVDICPRAPQPGAPVEQVRGAKRHEIDTRFEMELGKTAVLGGYVQERVMMERLVGLKSSETREVRNQVQTLFLVTPELVETDPAVSPASHQEPSEEPKAKPHHEGERRIKAIRLFDILPGQPQPRVRYSFPAETR